MKHLLEYLQSIGRALMLPIAVLPVAALLLRLGAPDLLDIAAMEAAGKALTDSLGLLFAIGLAVGLARENHGAAGLAGVVGYLVTIEGAEVLINVPATVTADLMGRAADLAADDYRELVLKKLSVLVGLLNGAIAGALYNRYSNIRLPDYLAFFGGRRFVPIASGFTGLALALVFGYGWSSVEHGMDVVSQSVLSAGAIGQFAYGVLNRALIVTGLHHIINNLAWFLLGEYNGATGDLKRFFAGDPQAGAFMSGFFPVMMFGLPAACLAMYRTALPARRKEVGGLLLSMALTSFLTGITEPIEFSFMFLAPVLYALHAVLTGVAMAGMNLFGIHLGFGFSAGLFDYVLNFSLATRPLLLLPIGAAYFALYYGLFHLFIVKFNLKTLGREDERESGKSAVRGGETSPSAAPGLTPAHAWIMALGGTANLRKVDACTTRLRLVVADNHAVNEVQLKKLGARGVVRPAPDALQVVIGPQADQIASEIREVWRTSAAIAADIGMDSEDAPLLPDDDEPLSIEPPPADPKTDGEVAESIYAALGGGDNIAELRLVASRVHVKMHDKARLEMSSLDRLGLRGHAITPAGALHLLIGPTAAAVHARLEVLRRGET